MKYLILILSLVLLAKISHAQKVQVDFETIRTINEIAKTENIKVEYLLRIAFVESRFKIDAINVNKNGTIDLGLFQINTIHWNTTCKNFDVFTVKGNTRCATKLIKIALKHKGKDAHWLGRYHSKTPSLKRKYYNLINSVDLNRIEVKKEK